jgi:hypothetical protein
MLQVALWMKAVSLRAGDEFPEISSVKLAAATDWLAGLTMPETGRVPNYGHNDGAYILPLTGLPFHDYRPVLQAASRFFGLPDSYDTMDEMTLWFEFLAGKKAPSEQTIRPVVEIRSYRKLVEGSTTVFIFAPEYHHRPGQADLLHTEIWRDGQPLLLDAGTFQYNAEPPWDAGRNAGSQHGFPRGKRSDDKSRAVSVVGLAQSQIRERRTRWLCRNDLT